MNREKMKTKRVVAPLLLLASSTYTVQALDITSTAGGTTSWAAMFGFATVGILSFGFSSYRFKKASRKHQEMMQLQDDVDLKHQMILESMTQNIEVSAKGIRRYKEVLKNNDLKKISPDVFQEEMHRFEESETLLLDATNELVDFLQVKSGNLEIVEEPYKLGNMLNETYGFVSNHINKNKSELFYDIDPDVATELKGDTKRIEQVLRTFLIDILTNNSNEVVTLKVSTSSNDTNSIRFELHNRDKKMLDEEIASLFSSYAISESYKSKEKLDLYVAYELIKLMNGMLDVQSNENDGTRYVIELPYKPLDITFLKSQNSHEKRLLILEDDKDRAQKVSQLFQKHDLQIESADSQSLVSQMPDFSSYDMIIVNTKLLFLTIVEKLEKAKKEKLFIIVETYNSFENTYAQKSHKLVDASIQKPLQNEQIYALLEKVFGTGSDEETLETQSNDFAPLNKVEEITTDSFNQFSQTQVLIVEDNLMNQKILRGVLRNSGMNITMVNNGKEAVEQIEQNKIFDLILMDTNMPVMDGYDATEIIRKRYDKKQLPIIALSAVGFKDDIVKMQKAGANSYLHKPFQLGELFSAFSMFGKQGKNIIKKDTVQTPKHITDKEILDIEKGVAESNSEVIYKELLQEVLVNLNEIDASVAKWIRKRNDKKIKEFISHALKLAETIGASSYEKILKEMQQLFIHKEENRLEEYLPLYTKEWKRLSEELEGYLKN